MTVEKVQPGEKGGERLRRDKSVKRYLLAKRPEVERQQIIDYRSQTRVAVHHARKDGADRRVQAVVLSEYRWAVQTLRRIAPEVLESLGYRPLGY